jgi:hypothetical protein
MVGVSQTRMRLGGAALLLAGIFFVLFPLIRPFGALEALSTDAAAVAAELSSAAWVVSHILALLAFVLLPAGLLVLYLVLSGSRVERLAFTGLVLTLLGAGMLTAVAGVEGFGLRAMGVLQQEGKADVLAGVAALRSGPATIVFLPGLLFVAAGGVIYGLVGWRSGSFPRWAAIALAIGLVFWLPLLPQPIRIVDGFLVGVGAMGVGWELWRMSSRPARTEPRPIS